MGALTHGGGLPLRYRLWVYRQRMGLSHEQLRAMSLEDLASDLDLMALEAEAAYYRNDGR